MSVQAYDRDRVSLVVPALAAVAAAAAGGVVWALIVKYTQYEVGIAAWAIGFLTATAAVMAARGYKSRTLQIIAIVAALVGILLGKYLSWSLWGEENGYPSWTDMWSWWDALWIGLAVVTAWQVADRDDEDVVADEQPAARPGGDEGERTTGR
jgi:hypothetical protein